MTKARKPLPPSSSVSSSTTSPAPPEPAPAPTLSPPVRRRLPDERPGVIHHFVFHPEGGVEPVDGYLITGHYPDGTLGEFFIHVAKDPGAMLQGPIDGWAVACSLLLQYGIPLSVITGKFAHWRFEPSGRTDNPAIKVALSVCDYVARWLDGRYGEKEIP